MKQTKIVLLLFFGLLILSCSSNQKKQPNTKNGVLDLRGWDFVKDGFVRLDGEWEFYWNQFLKSKDFDTVQTPHFITVPKPWNDYKWGSETLGYEGYATYRIKIIVNPDIKDFGLKFPDQGTAFELYLNDSLIGKNGKIGKKKETAEPQYKPLVIHFNITGDTIVIVCRISNYNFHFGGIYFASQFGSHYHIDKLRDKNYIFDYIISVSLFLMYLVFLVFYIVRPRDYISLVFSGFTFLAIFRTITVNERIINNLLPFLNWEWCIKLEAISWMAALPLGAYNLALLFKNQISKKILIILVVIFGISSLATIITPAYINSQFIIYGQGIASLTLLYFLFIFIKSNIIRLEGSIIAFMGWVPFLFGGINEVLYYDNVMPLYFTYPMGLVIYCFAWIIILSRRFTLAFYRVENFASELEQKVDERTKEVVEKSLIIEQEKQKSDKLLLNVLPEPIALRLKEGETLIADHFEEASVVFIDIVDFTKLSAKSNPQKMVKLLNDIFTLFDKIAAKYGVEKIKTIGDCYMAAAGIPVPRADHAQAISLMALEALETMKEYRTEDDVEIKFRIGLDCGPIVAGVIGEQKFIYDLWGDMVNTASRMETNGVIGKIQCTERFKEKLEIKNEGLGIKFENRGEIEIKGKGMMQTYFLEKEKGK